MKDCLTFYDKPNGLYIKGHKTAIGHFTKYIVTDDVKSNTVAQHYIYL